MYQAAQKIGLNPVGKQADRQECVRLARDLEEAAYVDVYAITYQGLRASYSATEEGVAVFRSHRSLEESLR